jgi:hypothetical protein
MQKGRALAPDLFAYFRFVQQRIYSSKSVVYFHRIAFQNSLFLSKGLPCLVHFNLKFELGFTAKLYKYRIRFGGESFHTPQEISKRYIITTSKV